MTTPSPGYYQDGAASVRGVALRVTRLDANGRPTTGSGCDVYLSGGFISFTFTPNYSEGEEIEIKNAAGEVCVYFKMPDTLKDVGVGLELCDPDPVLTQMLVGGEVLTGVAPSACAPEAEAGSSVAVGYAAEKQGIESNPYGVAIEVWAQAIVNGKAAGGCPYWHYLIPYAKFRLDGDRVVENGNLATVFAGTGGGNSGFGEGPIMDFTGVSPTPPPGAFSWGFPALTDRPYLYARETLAPVGLRGCFVNVGIPATGVTPGIPGTFQPANASTPADLAALQALGPLGQTTAWTVGQYVLLGDGTQAHWDGDSWEAGATPAPAQPATAANAGTPGSFSPTGSLTPQNLAAMSSVTAIPTTAWLTGQHVILGDATHAYWNATAWTTGNAP